MVFDVGDFPRWEDETRGEPGMSGDFWNVEATREEAEVIGSAKELEGAGQVLRERT